MINNVGIDSEEDVSCKEYLQGKVEESESDLGFHEYKGNGSHMVLAIDNDGTSDPLLDLGLSAIECKLSNGLSLAEIQNEG